MAKCKRCGRGGLFFKINAICIIFTAIVVLLGSCFPQTDKSSQAQDSQKVEQELRCSISVYDFSEGEEEIRLTSYESGSINNAQITINNWYDFRPVGGTMRPLRHNEEYIFSAYAFYDMTGKRLDPTKERIKEVEVKVGNKTKHHFNDIRFSIGEIEALCNDGNTIKVNFTLFYRNPEEKTQFLEYKQDIIDFFENEMKLRPSTDFDNYGLKINEKLIEDINQNIFNGLDTVKSISIWGAR
jgi:hypothetical protein